MGQSGIVESFDFMAFGRKENGRYPMYSRGHEMAIVVEFLD